MATPPTTDRSAYQQHIDQLRVREKAHTREGDAIASTRRHLPMVEVDATTPLIGANGPIPLLDVFEGRSQLFASFHMWHTGLPAADQCEGCTFNSSHARQLSYLYSRDVTFATFCQRPFAESDRYRAFMGWDGMPWYSVPEESYERLSLRSPRHFGMKVCYLRKGDQVFETYWTTGRGCEHMSGSYGMLDMMVYGRQERWEKSPEGWPQVFGEKQNPFRSEQGQTTTSRAGFGGRPIPQWDRLAAGHDEELGETATDGKGENDCH